MTTQVVNLYDTAFTSEVAEVAADADAIVGALTFGQTPGSVKEFAQKLGDIHKQLPEKCKFRLHVAGLQAEDPLNEQANLAALMVVTFGLECQEVGIPFKRFDDNSHKMFELASVMVEMRILGNRVVN